MPLGVIEQILTAVNTMIVAKRWGWIQDSLKLWETVCKLRHDAFKRRRQHSLRTIVWVVS